MESFQYNVVNNEIDCEKVCQLLMNESYVALDTEFFIQNKRFVLSLIQIATFENNYLFDMNFPANGVPNCLKHLLENQKIIKILHAHHQDYEVLENLNVKLSNVFDTQIAMMFLSAGEIYSYKDLVKEFLQLEIEKLHKNDDWEARPLSESQIQYAITDVSYLYKIYPLVVENLNAKGRLDWMKDYTDYIFSLKNKIKIDELICRYNISIKTDEQYNKFGFLYNLLQNKIPSNLLKNLIEAKNLTCNRIKHIIETTNIDLEIELIEKILDIVQSKDEDNVENKKIQQIFGQDCQLNYDESQIFSILKYFLRKISIKNSINSRLICEKNDLIFLIRKQPSCLENGWRFEIFGKIAIDLINGRLMFSIRDSKICMN